MLEAKKVPPGRSECWVPFDSVASGFGQAELLSLVS